MKVRITPSPVTGVVSMPQSKSYTHRAVIIASLASGETVIEGPLASDDITHTIDACRFLGADIKQEGDVLRVTGTDGRITASPASQKIFVGNSGSTIRMVAPVAALARERVVFDGDDRLRQRPIGDLLAALESLGVHARSLKDNGCPPIEIQGGHLSGGEVAVSGSLSSQPISSLLMVAPYADREMSVRLVDRLRSRPYVDITIDAMRTFGVEVINYSYVEFLVKGGQRYKGTHYKIEGDYSSAAYFFAAAAIGGSPLSLKNLRFGSRQGDRNFLTILLDMGCSVENLAGDISLSRNQKLSGITINMADYPDIVPPLAIVAAYADGRTEVSNIGHLRFKEADRIGDTAAELRKMGIKTKVTESTLVIYGGKPRGAEIEAHNDHRLAMSFAIAALFAEGVTVINGAEAVSKSYPRFFADLAGIGAKIEELP
ncbi:3-phosphoshikimate 1-carboxyvinyltransferase [Chloroflexota bacterium]